MKIKTKAENLQFILDGENFFEILHRRLNTLKEAESNEKEDTYVRIGMWVCHKETRLPAYGDVPETTLEKALEAVALAGHKVRLLLWEGSNAPQQNKEHETNLAMKFWSESFNRAHRNKATKGYLPISVELQEYDPNEGLVTSSNHQKIVIFSTGGTREVIIGGFNLGSNYFSMANHGQPSDDFDKDHRWRSNLWHDVAVSLDGDAATTVENIWIANWNRHKQDSEVEPLKVDLELEDEDQDDEDNEVEILPVEPIDKLHETPIIEVVDDPKVIIATTDKMKKEPHRRSM